MTVICAYLQQNKKLRRFFDLGFIFIFKVNRQINYSSQSLSKEKLSFLPGPVQHEWLESKYPHFDIFSANFLIN